MVPEHEHPVQAPGFWEVVESFHPLATLVAAIIAGVIAWRAIQQRSKADRRSEWWSRAQWALDASLADDNDRQEMGLKVVQVLTKSELATEEEIEIINVASEQPLARAAHRRLDHQSTLGDNDSSDKASEVDDEHESSGTTERE